MLFTDYNRFNNNLTIYTTVLICFIGERECQFINTWRGREHHSRKLEWAWSSVEIARRRFGGHRRYGSCRRQALHWTPVHQFHRRAGQEATRKRQLRQITRQSPVDGRPFCALSCWSIAQWSRRMRCHVCLRLVAAQRAQNSGNCDRRRNFQDVVAGFGSGFSSLSATGCVTTDARRSLKYARVDISGPRSPIRGVGLPGRSQRRSAPPIFRAPAAASVGIISPPASVQWYFWTHTLWHGLVRKAWNVKRTQISLFQRTSKQSYMTKFLVVMSNLNIRPTFNERFIEVPFNYLIELRRYFMWLYTVYTL